MSLAAELAGMETVEDLCQLLGLTPDPAVLRVFRLHVLRRFGRVLPELETRGESEAERREHAREALAQILAEYRCGRPAPVFAVARSGLVPLRRKEQP